MKKNLLVFVLLVVFAFSVSAKDIQGNGYRGSGGMTLRIVNDTGKTFYSVSLETSKGWSIENCLPVENNGGLRERRAFEPGDTLIIRVKASVNSKLQMWISGAGVNDYCSLNNLTTGPEYKLKNRSDDFYLE